MATTDVAGKVGRYRSPSGDTDSDRFFAYCAECGWEGVYYSNRTVEGRRLADRDARAHRCPSRDDGDEVATDVASHVEAERRSYIYRGIE